MREGKVQQEALGWAAACRAESELGEVARGTPRGRRLTAVGHTQGPWLPLASCGPSAQEGGARAT